MRTGMILMGIGLGILWIAGLYNHATGWLTWLDFVAALLSIMFAAAPETIGRPALLRAPPFVHCAVLLLLWIVGLATGATSWMVWWNFAFAIAYGLLGVGVTMPESRLRRPTVTRPTA